MSVRGRASRLTPHPDESMFSVSTQLFDTTVSKLSLKHSQGLMSLLIRGGRPDTPSPPVSGMWIFPPWSPATRELELHQQQGGEAKPISGRLGGGVTVLSAFITVKVILNFKCSCYCTHVNKETTNRPGSPPSAAKNNLLTGTDSSSCKHQHTDRFPYVQWLLTRNDISSIESFSFNNRTPHTEIFQTPGNRPTQSLGTIFTRPCGNDMKKA